MFMHLTCLRRNSIALMYVSAKSCITLQKTLTTSFACSTIALLEDDTFIVGTINHQHPVRTISVQGQEGDIRHKLLPDKKYRRHESSCTYVPCTKTVVFSDIDQDTVYMCDITSGESRVIKSDKIRGLWWMINSYHCATFRPATDTSVSHAQVGGKATLYLTYDSSVVIYLVSLL